MWNGLPPVGSTADAVAEVIADGRTGCLVPYADVAATAAVLIGLLGDEDVRRRLAEAGARRACERFAFPRFEADLLNALELGSQA